MNRRHHTDERLSENFTEDGLEKLTGQHPWQWLTYLTKELIDNSLEACDDASITIEGFNYHWGSSGGEIIEDNQKLSIRDNGPGIDEKTVHKIFGDINRFGGTKRHYKLPTRGNQGNALMTVLGIQHSAEAPLKIQSNDCIYTIKVVENALTGNYEVVIDKSKANENISGFQVNLDLSNNRSFGSISEDVFRAFLRFIELNPQGDFCYRVTDEANDEPSVYEFVSNGYKGHKFNLSEKATTGKVIWFTQSEFLERLKADVRIDKKIKLRDFISEFSSLSSVRKVSKVIDDFDLEGFETIGVFVNGDGSIKRAEAFKLYNSMYKNTKRYSERSLDKTIGSIGEEGMKRGLLGSLELVGKYGKVKRIVEDSREEELKIKELDDLIVYYGKGAITETLKVIPHYFEMIAIPMSQEKKGGFSSYVDLNFGINQSFIYSVPDLHLFFKRRSNSDEKRYSGIKDAFEAFDYDFKVVCNLMCPTVDFSDRGKQNFDLKPFQETINEVVRLVVSKITKDIIPTLNKLNESEEDYEEPDLLNKAPKGFIKDFVFNNFEQVFNKATDNGRFTITQRQFYYAMRPVFLETVERYGYQYTWDSNYHKMKKLELEYNTFCSYVDDYEVNVLWERIIYKKDRGFFVEPHSERHINLGTKEVKEYYPNLKQYNNLLFVEKSGFYELLHKDFELTKRYDIGLINAEGYANNATRDLIQKIQQANPDIKLYVLTDFDIDGLGIAKNVKKAEELSPVDIFDCARLGLTFEDVHEYDLSIEPVEYPKNKLTELENRYQAGEISNDVYDFLKEGQRVEINAFSPVRLKEYFEKKFEEFGIEKLKPKSEEDVETFEIEKVDDIRIDAIKNAIGEYVVERCEEDLFTFLQDTIYLEDEAKEAEEELKILTEEQAKTIYDEIIEGLKGYPPKSWYDINEEAIDRLRSEADNLEDEYKRAVIESAQELLKDSVSIKVEIR